MKKIKTLAIGKLFALHANSMNQYNLSNNEASRHPICLKVIRQNKHFETSILHVPTEKQLSNTEK